MLKVSSGTCQQFVEDAVKISKFFWIFDSYEVCSNILQVRWKSVCIHKEFPHESADERILKIGPHLLKLLSNTKGCTFWDTVQYVKSIV